MTKPSWSLATMLMNEGVTSPRRSVRGEPRGPVCGMGICFECRVSTSYDPHQRACMAVNMASSMPEPKDGDVIACDVVVVGGGPAGLTAAAAAAERGRRALIVDAAPNPGGQIWRHAEAADRVRSARRSIARAERAGVSVLSVAEVIDAPAPGELTLAMPYRTIAVRARSIVLATGARELFLPFPGWTLPNVVGIGGLQALAKFGLDVRGKRVVIAGSGPLLLPVARYLAARGADLAVVAEQAPPASVREFIGSLWRSPSRLAAAARMRAGFARTRYRFGTWVTAAQGDDRLREVTLTDGARTWREPCDYLACGFGLIPNVEVAQVLGADVSSAGITVDGRQETRVTSVFAAGECTGIGGAPLAIVEGEIAGLAAAGERVIPPALVARRDSERAFAANVARSFALRAELRSLAAPDTILCRCEDVPHGAVVAAHSAREAKLRTRAGMGACQGRVCGAAMQELFGWDPPEPRAPIFPARVGALANAARAAP